MQFYMKTKTKCTVEILKSPLLGNNPVCLTLSWLTEVVQVALNP